MNARENSRPRLINVDLDVDSTEDLRPLIDAMEPHTFSFDRPPGRASFEVKDPSPTDPETVILEFIELVKSLPPAARKSWNAASRRVFDIGLESGRERPEQIYDIGLETLRQATALGAHIVITLYPVDPEEDGE